RASSARARRRSGSPADQATGVVRRGLAACSRPWRSAPRSPMCPGRGSTGSRSRGWVTPSERAARSPDRRSLCVLTVGVEGVVDEGSAFQEPLIVDLDVETADADGQQPGALPFPVQVVRDVGRVHDPREPHEGGIAAEVELVYKDLEAALAPTVRVVSSLGIERTSALATGRLHNGVRRRVDDLSLWVDEAPDQPGT